MVDASGGGAAAGGRSDTKSVAFVGGFDSDVRTLSTGFDVGAFDGRFTDCCGTGMAPAVSGCDPCPATGEAWPFSALAIVGVGDNADAADCSSKIRDVEANM